MVRDGRVRGATACWFRWASGVMLRTGRLGTVTMDSSGSLRQRGCMPECRNL